MNRLILRQLRRLKLDNDEPPAESEQWMAFLERVSNSYDDADQSRYLLERSLNISSQELVQHNAAVRSASEAALAMSEERFRSAFHASAAGAAIIDVEKGQFQDINQAACDMLGYDQGELLKMTIEDLAHPDDRTIGAVWFRRVISGQIPSFQTNLRFLHRDGSTKHGLTSATVIREATGEGLHMVVQMIDITEQEAANQRLVALLDSKNELIASVSHELRTPLTAVLGYAEILREDSMLSRSQREEMTRAITEQGNELTNIIEDLLTAARIDTDTITLAHVSVDLFAQAAQVREALLQHVTDDVEIALRGRSIRAVADPARVRQIIRNLTTNALRYGGANIEISTTGSNSSAHVAVIDDGQGVPPSQEAEIFEPYHRAHDEAGLTASVGLGLTISRKLARLMGGDVTYRRSNERSIFELALPTAALAPFGDDPVIETLQRERIPT